MPFLLPPRAASYFIRALFEVAIWREHDDAMCDVDGGLILAPVAIELPERISLSIDEHSAEQPMEMDPSTQQFPFQFRLGTKGLGIDSFAYTEAPFEPKMRAVADGEHSAAVELTYCGANYCTTIELPAAGTSANLRLHISVAPFSRKEIDPLQLDANLKQ